MGSSEESYRIVTDWLIYNGLEPVDGKVLDDQGCCIVSKEESNECLIILPPNEKIMYFVTELYTPILESDVQLVNWCLELNCTSLLELKNTAIALDAENQSLILRGTYTVYSHDTQVDLDTWLQDFFDSASKLKEEIHYFLNRGGNNTF